MIKDTFVPALWLAIEMLLTLGVYTWFLIFVAVSYFKRSAPENGIFLLEGESSSI